MDIEFRNLSDEEKGIIFQLGEEYPDDILVRDVVASFDGSSAMQIIGFVADVVTICTPLIACLMKIIDMRKVAPSEKPIIIHVIMEDGTIKSFGGDAAVEEFINAIQ